MLHVFLLLVYLGTGDTRELISDNMYFRSIDDCNYFASQLAKRYGNYRHYHALDPRDKVTAYCVPKYVQNGSVEVY